MLWRSKIEKWCGKFSSVLPWFSDPCSTALLPSPCIPRCSAPGEGGGILSCARRTWEKKDLDLLLLVLKNHGIKKKGILKCLTWYFPSRYSFPPLSTRYQLSQMFSCSPIRALFCKEIISLAEKFDCIHLLLFSSSLSGIPSSICAFISANSCLRRVSLDSRSRRSSRRPSSRIWRKKKK